MQRPGAIESIALADFDNSAAPDFEERMSSEGAEAETEFEKNVEVSGEDQVSTESSLENVSTTADFAEGQGEIEFTQPAEKRSAVVSKRALIEELATDLNVPPASEQPEVVERLTPEKQPVLPEEEVVETKPEPDEASDSEPLFASEGQDRSPAAWAARLNQSTPAAAKPDANPRQSRAVEVPPMRTTVKRQSKFFNAASVRPQSGKQTVSDAARQFLKPLMGFDPGTVPIHQSPKTVDPTPFQPLGSEADAVTDGDSIVLGSTAADSMPEQLGLLAHELTHVARSKQPRFVPPIARGAAEPPIVTNARRFVSAQAPQTESGEFTPAVRMLTEEELAQRVEARVIRRAAENETVPAMLAGRQASAGESGESDAGEMPYANEILSVEAGKVDWGGLPAPWEPLPGQTFSQAEPAQEQSNQVSFPNAVSAESSESDSNGVFSRQGSSASLQRAERGREIADFPATLKTAFLPDGSTAPDLDALARQVYEILKRRLAAERRREPF